MTIRSLWAALGLCALTALACGDDTDSDAEHEESTVASTCGAGQTFETQGAPFLTTYCTSCHGANVTGLARMSAPVGADLESHGKLAADRVRDKAMPPSSAKQPTTAERDAFLAWMKCSGTDTKATTHTH
jgi:uncharacterized membrane protein